MIRAICRRWGHGGPDVRAVPGPSGRRYGPPVSRPGRSLRPLVTASSAVSLLLLAAAATAGEAPATGQSAAAEAEVVTVSSFRYAPEPAQVTAGSSIRWTWRGEDRHSVTADDLSFDSDPGCDDNVLLRENCRTEGSDDFVWTAPQVTERTEIAYRCKLHGASKGMTGTVVVLPPPEPSPSEPSEPADGASDDPSPSSSSGDDGGADRSGSTSGDGGDEPDSGPRYGRAPQLGTQTAPTAAGGASVASPEVAAPMDDPELEPFPSPAPVPSATDDLGEVALDVPGGGGILRTVLLSLAVVGVAGTAIAFGSMVLFGPRWR